MKGGKNHMEISSNGVSFGGMLNTRGKKPGQTVRRNGGFNLNTNVGTGAGVVVNGGHTDTFTFDKILGYNRKAYADEAEINTLQLEALKARYGGDDLAASPEVIAKAILGY